MAYADRNTSGSRVVSIVIVSIIVAAFGWAFVNGLTYKFVKKVAEKLNTFDVVEPPPPPPDKPPPPPPEQQPQLQTPPVVSPPPLVRVQSPPPPITVQATIPPSAPVVVVAAKPGPVIIAPVAPTISKAAGPKGNPADWFSTDDYPSDALSAEAQGTTGIKWEINTAGRVENCVVTRSSGNKSLDNATCRAVLRRGKYTPALDQNGQPMRSSSSRNVVWRLPE